MMSKYQTKGEMQKLKSLSESTEVKHSFFGAWDAKHFHVAMVASCAQVLEVDKRSATKTKSARGMCDSCVVEVCQRASATFSTETQTQKEFLAQLDISTEVWSNAEGREALKSY